jgi:hypothetical protein
MNPKVKQIAMGLAIAFAALYIYNNVAVVQRVLSKKGA